MFSPMPYVSIACKGDRLYVHKPLRDEHELKQEEEIGQNVGYDLLRVFAVDREEDMWQIWHVVDRELRTEYPLLSTIDKLVQQLGGRIAYLRKEALMRSS